MFGFEVPIAEGRRAFRSEGRLPPGQSLTLKFPVLHYGPGPASIPPCGISVCGAKSKKRSAGHGMSSINCLARNSKWIFIA